MNTKDLIRIGVPLGETSLGARNLFRFTARSLEALETLCRLAVVS